MSVQKIIIQVKTGKIVSKIFKFSALSHFWFPHRVDLPDTSFFENKIHRNSSKFLAMSWKQKVLFKASFLIMTFANLNVKFNREQIPRLLAAKNAELHSTLSITHAQTLYTLSITHTLSLSLSQNTHLPSLSQTHTDSLSFNHTLSLSHTHSFNRTRSLSNTHSFSLKLTHIFFHFHTHIHTLFQSHTLSLSQSHTHTHTQTHTHTHTHTLTHTQTQTQAITFQLHWNESNPTQTLIVKKIMLIESMDCLNVLKTGTSELLLFVQCMLLVNL